MSPSKTSENQITMPKNQTAVMPVMPVCAHGGFRRKIMHLLSGLLLLATEGCATLSLKTASDQDVMRRSEAVARGLGGEIGVDDNRTTIINCETGPEPMELLRELEELNSRVLPGAEKEDIATEPLETEEDGMVKKWLACLKSILKTPASAAPASQVSATKDTCGFNELEQAEFKILNKERAANGASPLACDPIATRVARAHSQDMCDRNFFSHINPDGENSYLRLRKAGASFRGGAGENIYRGGWIGGTPEDAHRTWMGSQGHRENILRPYWDKVGIGFVSCSGEAYWTEVFLS